MKLTLKPAADGLQSGIQWLSTLRPAQHEGGRVGLRR